MRIASISRYLKAKLESPINPKHLEQQFCEKINCKGFGSRQVKAAKGNLTMTGVFIPYETIKKNEFLRNIWDCALDYLCSHSQELEKFIDDSQQYRISRGILQALIDEMDYTYEKAEYFDTSNYSKDNPEIKTSF